MSLLLHRRALCAHPSSRFKVRGRICGRTSSARNQDAGYKRNRGCTPYCAPASQGQRTGRDDGGRGRGRLRRHAGGRAYLVKGADQVEVPRAIRPMAGRPSSARRLLSAGFTSLRLPERRQPCKPSLWPEQRCMTPVRRCSALGRAPHVSAYRRLSHLLRRNHLAQRQGPEQPLLADQVVVPPTLYDTPAL